MSKISYSELKFCIDIEQLLVLRRTKQQKRKTWYILKFEIRGHLLINTHVSPSVKHSFRREINHAYNYFRNNEFTFLQRFFLGRGCALLHLPGC